MKLKIELNLEGTTVSGRVLEQEEDEVNGIVVEKIKRQITRVELEKEQKWAK